ncbi:nucleotidyltransferase family protein [Microcoleus sp. FACHB-672]|uniref:nucleotidyltransferase family protein n=1 Tax=Microcoleus sp. FACHB-672 TaxID=2692825 RepID=UPI001687354C|nr:nucleotidyltransferase domain-containing protein [Microcoleus sp. FACHB-672]MBD2042768.1 nucleotidyltransferase domain-containing protein [Microcoleus sp. FACHB-672]
MVEQTLELSIDFPKEQITDFCLRWQIKKFALFGSVLREDFRDDSDIDVLVTFDLDAHWGLLDHVRMERELCEIFGREVDLIERLSIEESPNWIRRKEILNTAQNFYVKG